MKVKAYNYSKLLIVYLVYKGNENQISFKKFIYK